MTTTRSDLRPEVGTNGDGPRSVGNHVVHIAKNMLTHPEHKPSSPSDSRQSSSNQGAHAVHSPSRAHDGRGRKVKWEIPDKAGEIIYAGRSKDMAKRMKVQLGKISGASDARGVKMTGKHAVRALEDLAIRDLNLIKKGQNMINGISDSSKNKKKYYKALIKAMSHLK